MIETDPETIHIRARMAESRAEIRRLLDPPPVVHDVEGAVFNAQFPRSKTMKLLLSGRGVGTVGAVVGGLLIARPMFALRLLRALPTGALARMLLVKAIAAFRGGRRMGRDDRPPARSI